MKFWSIMASLSLAPLFIFSNVRPTKLDILFLWITFKLWLSEHITLIELTRPKSSPFRVHHAGERNR